MKKIDINISDKFQKIKNKAIAICSAAGAIFLIGLIMLIVAFSIVSAEEKKASEALDVSISDTNLQVEYNYFLGYSATLTGKIKNNTNDTVRDLKLTYILYDTIGKEICKDSCTIKVLGEESIEPFKITFSKYSDEEPVKFRLYELSQSGDSPLSSTLAVFATFFIVGGAGIFVTILVKYKKDKYKNSRVLTNSELKKIVDQEFGNSDYITISLYNFPGDIKNIDSSMKIYIDEESEKICLMDYNNIEASIVDLDDIEDLEVSVNGNLFKYNNKANNWDALFSRWKNITVNKLSLIFKLNDKKSPSIVYDFEEASLKNGVSIISNTAFDCLQQAFEVLGKFITPTSVKTEKKKKWKCPYCGVLNSDDANVCSGCGSRRK